MRQRLDFRSADEFGAYHDLYAGGSTVSRSGTAFRAAVAAYRSPRMLLFDRAVVGAVHHRDAAQARRDGLDHFTLQVLRRGRMLAGQAGAEKALHPGDVAVFGTTRPQRTVVEGARYVALTLPRDVVEAALPGARDLHGAVLPRAAAGLLGDFILSLARNARSMGPDTASRCGVLVAELLAGVAGDRRPRADAAERDLPLQGARAESYIEAHLHDRELDVDRVAAALGLSRATLYRAFAASDGVARHILRRRLRRMRAALAAPGETRSVATLSFDLGFASESHCSRAFKAAFGTTPGRFRAEARHGPRAGTLRGDEASAGALMAWYHDLA